jgi:alpha-tubulin suppressor-like RCC1 family protein
VLAAAALLRFFAAAPPAYGSESFISAWGFGKDGELGDGARESSAFPLEVHGLRRVADVAAGGSHALALLEDGTVVAWGKNTSGQLGDGATANTDEPVPVSGLTGVTALAAGERHSLARLRDGTVMAWGSNEGGQLGDGSNAERDVPIPVPGVREAVAVAAGGSFSLALLRDGTVLAWGENDRGQLGDGDHSNSDTPIAVAGLSGVASISAGFRHSLALLSNGGVMAWGANEYGQLGDGSEADRDVPAAVRELNGVRDVSAGQSQSLALLANGLVVAWGDNEKGELGSGARAGPERCGSPALFACSRLPTRVSGLSEVEAIAAGSDSLALLHGGAVMAWGPNDVGQLGDGSSTGPEVCGPLATSCSTVPVTVRTSGVAVGIAGGWGFSLARTTPLGAGMRPEIGRCVNVPGNGAYMGRSPRCLIPSRSHTGNFEWVPGPGPKPAFTDEFSQLQLETVGGRRLVCSQSLLEGEYTGRKSEKINRVALTDCLRLDTNAPCQSDPARAGVIESSLPLLGYLGYIVVGERPRVGWSLSTYLGADSLLSFQCGSGTGVDALSLEGSVIARTTPIDRMVSDFSLAYRQTGGAQVPEAFQGEPPNVLTLTSMVSGTPEQAGVDAKGLCSDEEAMEIKAKL